MPRKIKTEIDLQILSDLALGLSNKEIASKYNLSESYISKVKTGKKQTNIYVANIPEGDSININSNILNQVLSYINNSSLFLSNKEDVIKYLNDENKKLLIRMYVNQSYIKKLKEKGN